MAGKTFEMLFTLQAQLEKSFSKSFLSAVNATNQLSGSMQSLKKQQGDIQAYQKQNATLQNTIRNLGEMEKAQKNLEQALKDSVKPSAKLQKSFESNERQCGEATKKLAELQEKHKDLARAMKETDKPSAKLQKDFEKSKEKCDAAAKKLAELQDKHIDLAQAMKETKQPSAKLQKDLEKSKEKYEDVSKQMTIQSSQLQTLQQKLQASGINTANLAGENEKLSKSYERLQKSQEKLNRLNQAKETNSAAIGQVQGQLTRNGLAVGGAAAAVYKSAIEPAMEYQTVMAKVSTIADTSAVPLETMQKEIMTLSSKMGVASATLGEDVYNAISAGQKTEDAIAFVEQATKLAKGGFAETSQTLDVLTTTLNAYGMSASETEKISDMLIQTQNKGKVTVGELSSVMGKIIPTAKANNVALEQLLAGYSILTSNGIAAAESTTYMNSMFNELGKTGTKADKALRAMSGKSFQQLMDSGSSVAEVLAMLEESAAASKLTLADMFGSAEAGKAAMSLMSGGVENFNDAVEGMQNSSGAAQAAFEKMSSTLQERVNKIKTTFSNIGITLGDTFIPYLEKGADAIQKVATKVQEWTSAHPKMMDFIVKIGAGIAAFAVAAPAAKLLFLNLKGGVLSVATAFTAMQAAGTGKSLLAGLGGLGKKLLPIVAIAGGIAAAFKLVSKNLGAVRGWIEKTFGQKGLDTFNQIWSVIRRIKEGLTKLFSGDMTGAGMIFENLFKDMQGGAGEIFSSLQGFIGDFMSQLPGLLSKGAEILLPLLADLGQVFLQVVPVIMDLFATLGPILADFAQQLLPVIANLLETLGPVIADLVQDILPILIEIIGNIITAVGPIIQAVLPLFIKLIEDIGSLFSGLLPILTPVLEVIGNVLGATLETALEGISGSIDGLMQMFEGIIQFFTGVFTGDWEMVWEGLVSILEGAFKGVVNLIILPINGLIDGINFAIKGLNQIKLPDWLGGGGLNIPEIPKIPQFAKGTTNTPDTFIAGENGPELITNAPGRRVFTAGQTRSILQQAPSVQTSVSETPNSGMTLYFSPTIYAENKNKDEILQMLLQLKEEMKQECEKWWRKKCADERRMRFD